MGNVLDFWGGHVGPYIGHILTIYRHIYGHGRSYFFIDARDGTGGRQVGGRMSRASMKKTKN